MIEPARGRLVHVSSGRVRIRLQTRDLTAEDAGELKSGLATLQGVLDARVTPASASVVVRYNPAEVDLDTLLSAARAAGLLDVDSTQIGSTDADLPLSLSAQRIKRTFHEVDVQLGRVTGGQWDLRSTFPVLLGLLAVRQILAGGLQLGAIPWWVLAWYSFDSFYKLNQERQRASRATVLNKDEPNGEG